MSTDQEVGDSSSSGRATKPVATQGIFALFGLFDKLASKRMQPRPGTFNVRTG